MAEKTRAGTAKPAEQPALVFSDTRYLAFLLDVLSEMALALGYKNLKQTEIDRFYSPTYFGSQMSRQEILFQENLRVLMHSKSAAESFSDEEYEKHHSELMQKGSPV